MIRTLVAAVATALFTWGGAAAAQEKFPSRPIETIVNFGPGGGADQLGRIASQVLERILGVALPVSNIIGASGNTGERVGPATPRSFSVPART